MASSALRHWNASPTKEGCHWQAGGEYRQTRHGQSSLISLTHHCYDWHPGSRCGWTCNQLTSKVDGDITGSQLKWSTLIPITCDFTIGQPGFDLPRQQWSPLNRFRTEQGHCDACRRKWRLRDTDMCRCGETQTMSHIVENCPLTTLNGGLSRLHSADEGAVSWLTSYGSWNAWEDFPSSSHDYLRLLGCTPSVLVYRPYKSLKNYCSRRFLVQSIASYNGRVSRASFQ